MKTHWKKLQNPDYLGAWDFQPNEIKLLTIKQVRQEEVYNQQSKSKELCSVCHFVENAKPMILNTTNSKAITELLKTPYIEDWVNEKIAVRVEQIKAFGQLMDAVRICDLPQLNQNHPKWQSVVKALKEKTATLEQVKMRFVLTNEIEQKLCENLK